MQFKKDKLSVPWKLDNLQQQGKDCGGSELYFSGVML